MLGLKGSDSNYSIASIIASTSATTSISPFACRQSPSPPCKIGSIQPIDTAASNCKLLEEAKRAQLPTLSHKPLISSQYLSTSVRRLCVAFHSDVLDSISLCTMWLDDSNLIGAFYHSRTETQTIRRIYVTT